MQTIRNLIASLLSLLVAGCAGVYRVLELPVHRFKVEELPAQPTRLKISGLCCT